MGNFVILVSIHRLDIQKTNSGASGTVPRSNKTPNVLLPAPSLKSEISLPVVCTFPMIKYYSFATVFIEKYLTIFVTTRRRGSRDSVKGEENRKDKILHILLPTGTTNISARKPEYYLFI
ncbi:hypothetical protein [Breoghania sp.]|uniref:hypothetical protein n=1 Tax=Breoghania sp. TaxID=2065378 RepID=UPI00261AA7A5|nr:hypothetical protein [Breoghania sp.]MDJ0932968.1 hypothetical protein [Breoghania sp.]